MEPRTAPFRSTIASALLLAIPCLALGATSPSIPPAQEAVELTAWLHVEDLTMADVTVQVEVNGITQTAHANENGRVTVMLPADAEAVLRFEKPGHLAKEVVVDTHNVREGDFGQRRTRKLSIAVILHLERHMAGLTYAGPVGTLNFEQGGGCLAVEHDRRTVPAKRQATMTF
ncbi:MAG: hypothetical protein IPL52_15055 [Flavobacteriales bacterium]|nr:hypothetical protein [Flavobacteriales bacterium]